MRIVLPPEVGRRALDVAQGRLAAVPLVPAATIVLLRPDAAGGVQAYLQRRHRGMAFAGGKFAFPGGRIDPVDAAECDDVWIGQSPQGWADAFAAASAEEARAHVVGGIRELFEETGVLLCAPESAAAEHRAPAEAHRAAVGGGLPVADLMRTLGCRLDTTALRAWSRWVTPRFERRRFDAWFFLARLPDGQQPRVATQESHDGRWVTPAQAMDELRRGDLPMLPPTWWTLSELARFSSVDEVMAATQPVVRYTVGWTREGDDVVMALPDDPRYPGDDENEGT